MKDTNGNPVTEEEFMKDIGHGVVTQEKYKCTNNEDCWHEFMYQKIMVDSDIELNLKQWRYLLGKVESLLKEQRNTVLEEALTNVDKMAVYQLQEGGSQYVSKKMLKILLESLKHHE